MDLFSLSQVLLATYLLTTLFCLKWFLVFVPVLTIISVNLPGKVCWLFPEPSHNRQSLQILWNCWGTVRTLKVKLKVKVKGQREWHTEMLQNTPETQSCSFHTFKYKQVRCIRYISGSQTGNAYFGLPPWSTPFLCLHCHIIVNCIMFFLPPFVPAMGGTQLKTFTRGGGKLVDKG